MYRLNIKYRIGTTQDGRKYKVPYTLDFGYNLTVQLNGNMKTQTDAQGDFIVYNPEKAGIKLGSNGYLVLHVID